MLSPQSRPYIDASVPVLREHGETITRVFYASLLDAHPELKHVFNMANQASGRQAQSLAAAVFAYAANIDNAAALGPVVERIVHKHVSLGVREEHYPLVGQHLLAAIAEVLGESATPALLDAWAEAYGLLAGQLIEAERRLYAQAGIVPGQMLDLTVSEVTDEGAGMRSFSLVRTDGMPLPSFVPGQYVSVAVQLPSGLRQLRQYSLSDAPGKPAWRIGVKREQAIGTDPAGAVSNWLHDHVQTGSVLSVSVPFGEFTVDAAGDAPLVLLSAGAGITPMMSMLNAIAEQRPEREVLFVYAARDGAALPYQRDIDDARARMPALRCVTFLEIPNVLPSPTEIQGMLRIDALPDWPTATAKVYLCGPLGFLRAAWTGLLAAGVPPGNLHREVFGPELLDHLL